MVAQEPDSTVVFFYLTYILLVNRGFLFVLYFNLNKLPVFQNMEI